MAIYEPRTQAEIHAAIVARLVARTVLTDVSEGGVAAGITGAVADEIEGVEYAVKQVVDAYALEGAEGTLLDERCAQFPGGGLVRLGPSAATGNGLVLTRDNTDPVAQVVPAGTVYGRSDDASVLYVQLADATIAAGQASYPVAGSGDPNVAVVSSVLGDRGNAAVGVIDTIISGPDWLQSVSQAGSVAGGLDRESDAQLRKRALLWMSALARTQKAALEYIGLTFRPSSGARFRHAIVFEPPDRPGYCELLADDGASAGKKGITVTGTVPAGGQTAIYHEFPAKGPITPAQFKVNGAPSTIDYVSIPERGLIYPESGQLLAGDTWEVSGYDVYTGGRAELQREVEGDPSDPTGTPGWRAAGCRVRVVAPTEQWVKYRINVVVFEGVDLVAAALEVERETVEYLDTLAPGEPAFIAELYRILMSIPGIRNVAFMATDEAGNPATTTDVYPATPTDALRTTTTLVETT